MPIKDIKSNTIIALIQNSVITEKTCSWDKDVPTSAKRKTYDRPDKRRYSTVIPDNQCFRPNTLYQVNLHTTCIHKLRNLTRKLTDIQTDSGLDDG